MNKQLKLKRDDETQVFEAEVWRLSSWKETSTEDAFKQGFDAAIQAVLELIGEFDHDEFNSWLPLPMPTRKECARWQHTEILRKIKGEEG